MNAFIGYIFILFCVLVAAFWWWSTANDRSMPTAQKQKKQTVRDEASEKRRSDSALCGPVAEGKQAARDGKPIYDNPYADTMMVDPNFRFHDWMGAWCSEMKKINCGKENGL